MKKVTKIQAKKIYNDGKSVYLSNESPFSSPRAINKKDGVNLQSGNETDFEEIVKDWKYFNKKNPSYYVK
jgi:hypothetical protein